MTIPTAKAFILSVSPSCIAKTITAIRMGDYKTAAKNLMLAFYWATSPQGHAGWAAQWAKMRNGDAPDNGVLKTLIVFESFRTGGAEAA